VQTAIKRQERKTFRIVSGKIEFRMGNGGHFEIRRFLTGNEHYRTSFFECDGLVIDAISLTLEYYRMHFVHIS
jgi:1,4-alpha-glucan branching enzyme